MAFIGVNMPQVFYTQEEYIAAEQRALLAEERNATLESLRPQWAQGFTKDSVAAQVSSGALAEIWALLGVDNQTQAIATIRHLLCLNHFR